MRSPSSRDAGQLGGHAPRRDEDPARREADRALFVLDDDLTSARDPPVPRVTRDLVLAEESVDSPREGPHCLVLALQHGAQVQGHGLEPDTVRPDAILASGVQLARLEERLARDAAHAQAGPTESGLALDTGDVQPELGGPDCGDVAAGTGADHDEVVLRPCRHHQISSRRRAGSSMHSFTCFRKLTASRPSTIRWS